MTDKLRTWQWYLLLAGGFCLPLTWEPVFDAGFPLKLYEIFFGLVIIAALFFRREYTDQFHNRYLLPMFLFLAVTVITGAASIRLLNTIPRFPYWATGRDHPYLSILYESAYLIFDMLVMLIVVYFGRMKERRNRLIWVMVIGSIPAVGYGFYQVVAYYGGFSPSVFPTMPQRKAVFDFIIPRISSFFKEPNYLAGYLVCLMPLTVGLLYNKKIKPLLPALLSVLQFACLYLTFSTAGWLAFLAGIMLQTWLLRKEDRKVSAIIAGSAATAVMVLIIANPSIFYQVIYDKLFGRFVNPNTISRIQRKEQILNALLLFKRQPLFGIGLSNYGILADHLLGVKSAFNLTVNNIYAELLCETGPVGLGFFLWFLWRLFRGMISFRTGENVLRVSLLVSFLSLVLIFNVYPSHSPTYIWVLFGLYVGFFTRKEEP